MNAADFELNLSVPAEPRFAETMRDLAAHAARYAGCDEQAAARYGAAVADIVRSCLEKPAASGSVRVILRRGNGPVEFLIGCEGRFESAKNHGHVTVGWTREQGIPMCRVALVV